MATKNKKSILNKLGSVYNSVYKNDRFNANEARLYFSGKKQIEERVKILEELYELVLETEFLSEYTQDWVKSGASIEYSVKNTNRRKLVNKVDTASGIAKVNYDIQKIKNYLNIKYGDKDVCIFDVIDSFLELKDNELVEIESSLHTFRMATMHRWIDKRDMIINIPTKYVSDKCNKKEFEQFLELIKPYSTKAKQRCQKQVNQMTDSIAYFNYVMSSNTLTETDLKYRRKIERWLAADSDNESEPETESETEFNFNETIESETETESDETIDIEINNSSLYFEIED